MKVDWIEKLESLRARIHELENLTGEEKAVEAAEVLKILDELIVVFIEEIKALFCMG